MARGKKRLYVDIDRPFKTLSRHARGSQIVLPFYGAMVTLSQYGKMFEAGRYNINGKVLYVNRGIGMEGGHVPRVRFFVKTGGYGVSCTPGTKKMSSMDIYH